MRHRSGRRPREERRRGGLQELNDSPKATIRTTETTAPRILLAFSLGSNLGAREANLGAAIEALEHAFGPLRVASLYETPAVGPNGEIDRAQPPYLNTAAIGAADRDGPFGEPEQVLAFTHGLERAAGRRSGGVRYAPRPLDVDLLLVGTARRDEPALTLPHPRMHQRLFVLAPLAEVMPDLALPPDGTTAAAALAALRARCDLPIARRPWHQPDEEAKR